MWMTRRIMHIGRQAIALDRAVRGPGRAGRGHLDRFPGLHQHGREPGRAADQGPDPAADELRRIGDLDEPVGARGACCASDYARTAQHACAAGRACSTHLAAPTRCALDHGRRHRRPHLPGAGRGRGLARARLARALAGRRHGSPAWKASWCRRAGFAFETIDFSGVRGKGLDHAGAAAAAPAASAFWQSIAVVRRVRPDVVVGLGGYIAFPAGMMSVLLRQAAGAARAELGGRHGQQGAGRRGRPRVHRFPGRAAESAVDRQSAARRRSRPARARRALRRPQRPAEAAGGRRQPGRAGAQRRRAARRWR